MKRKPLVASVLLVAFAIACGPGFAASKDDEHGEKVMAATNKAEARQWLKDSSRHLIFKGDRKEVVKLVEDFYKAGATKVFICDIESHDGNDYAGGLLIVLPKDSDARGKVFKVAEKADTAFENDPTKDEGQKYIYYAFD